MARHAVLTQLATTNGATSTSSSSSLARATCVGDARYTRRFHLLGRWPAHMPAIRMPFPSHSHTPLLSFSHFACRIVAQWTDKCNYVAVCFECERRCLAQHNRWLQVYIRTVHVEHPSCHLPHPSGAAAAAEYWRDVDARIPSALVRLITAKVLLKISL